MTPAVIAVNGIVRSVFVISARLGRKGGEAYALKHH
jgi:hypothetical protein